MDKEFRGKIFNVKVINKCKLILQQRDPIFPIRLLRLKL